MNALSKISECIIDGFALTTILLSLAYWFLPAQRQSIRKFFPLSNTYLIIGSFIFLALSVGYVLSDNAGNGEGEMYALVNRISGPYWFAYWAAILFKGLLPQLFWIKKVRQNMWASIVLAPFLLVDFYMTLLLSYSGHNRPSSWTFDFSFSGLFLNGLIFGSILAITFILTRNRNRV